MKFTSVSDERVLSSGPQKGGSFPVDRVTPQPPMSFAIQKRTLAFNYSKQYAPFGVNRKQNGFLEKVCKSVLFFAHIPEMDSPEWQTGALSGPDWRWNHEGSGSVYLRRCRKGCLGKIIPGYHKSYPAVNSFFIVLRSLRYYVADPAIIERIGRIFLHGDRPVHFHEPVLNKHRFLLSAHRDQAFFGNRA